MANLEKDLYGQIPTEVLKSLSDISAVSSSAAQAVSKSITVKYHNLLEGIGLQITKGGCPVNDLWLIFNSENDAGTVTRGDSISWTSEEGGGWRIGNGIFVTDPSTNEIVGLGLVSSFSSDGYVMNLSLALFSFANGSYLYNISPAYNFSVALTQYGDPELPVQLDPDKFLKEGDLILDLGTDEGAVSGIYVVDRKGWTLYEPTKDPDFCRFVFVKYPDRAGSHIYSLESSLPASDTSPKLWKMLDFDEFSSFKIPCRTVTQSSDVERSGSPVSGIELVFANDSPDTITRSVGSWIADGFKQNTAIITTGASNSANNRFLIVYAATDTKLTVKKPNGTDAGFVNETTSNASVKPTVDGNIGLNNGDRVLDIDNSVGSRRAIYVVGPGSAGWSFSKDGDGGLYRPKLKLGTVVPVFPGPDSSLSGLWVLKEANQWENLSTQIGNHPFSFGNPNDGDAIIWNSSQNRFTLGSGGGGGGGSSFDGIMTTSLQFKRGTTVNAGTGLNIDAATGNMFKINPGGAIETIEMASSWQDGSVVFLFFTSADIQVKSDQAFSGNKANISLTGGADFWSSGEADCLVLQKTGTTWYEIARKQATTGFAEVASDSTISLPINKDTFTITGTATINLISNYKIPDGKIVTLWFRDGGGTLTHGASNDATNIGLYLNGATDLVWGAGDTVTLRQFATKWIEIGRSMGSSGV